ncbi:hypothetical protein H310_01348 [Aphanomyces invadans]|uniref:Mannosylglycerate hydrolase MGH1-like glycoside hydrolase domain-containing protein n=1 Tax=Aphanomyces invadans TaxID=157072 RepID=A0A024URB4_9STRA|nr:hypothetical protein H310_01348 [Aphanomyces invadans]ETW08844.1 hypothetical protein H310_01348 [Aphanomyces invadans]|eukprot:XP_008862649.1 hypothetical protein H310_01348 [Aphanomyces invadans]
MILRAAVLVGSLVWLAEAWIPKIYLAANQDQLDSRHFDPDDLPPQVPRLDEIVKAAFAVLKANFDDQMNATAPGPQEDIGFQHINSRDALLAAQALAHHDFTHATVQFKSLLSHQWSNGFMPDLIYGPSVGASLSWLPTNKTFYPGPAFWSVARPSDSRTNSSTSGILAPPMHAETAMRIFYLAPLDTSMSTPVYTHEAMGFLCDVFPSLYKFHAYLLASRQATNTSLLSLRHPWESMAAINPGLKEALAPVKNAADFAQVISRLQVPKVTAQAFADQAAVFYPGASSDEIVQDIYHPILYLATCFVDQRYNESAMKSKCAAAFNAIDVEFNTVFLRSAEALVDMAKLLYQPVTKLGFSCPMGLPNKAQVEKLAAVVKTLTRTLRRELWDPKNLIFRTSHNYVTGMFPLFATALDETIQMGLIQHVLPTSTTFHYLCDEFPVSMYPCEAIAPTERATAASDVRSATTTSRVGLMVHNYMLYRGLLKNSMHGIARYLLHRTFALISASQFQFMPVFDATTGHPPATTSTSASTMAAAVVVNLGLADVTNPPSPDTPPIDRQAMLIVMCIELVVAMGVAVSCVVFSVYFVVKRPRGDAAVTSQRPSVSALNPEPSTTGPTGSPDKRHLEESLLSDDDDHDEYGSFLSSPAMKPAVGMWSSVKGFVSSISPWG